MTPAGWRDKVGLWLTVDGTESIGVRDASGLRHFSTIGAQFLLWADIEIMPVARSRKAHRSGRAGGLFKLN